MNILRKIILTLLFSVIFPCCAYASSTTLRILAISDIHFDPFIICKVQRTKPCPLIKQLNAAPASRWAAILKANDVIAPALYRDTGYSTLVSTLSSAKEVANTEQVQFVLTLGDLLGHDYRRLYKLYAQDSSRAHYQEFVHKTFVFLFAEMHKAFPSLDVYTVVGNNDSYRYDYYVEPQSTFFRDLQTLNATLIGNPQHRAELQKTFSLAGYYAIELTPQSRLLVLDSVLFSNKVRGVGVERVANQELDWLHQQLQLAKQKQQRVFIAMHIPEGKDLYATSSIKLFRILDLWQASYTKRFNAEITQYATQIAGIFTGHLHIDSFHVLSLNDKEVDVVGIPSISPIFGNLPGFTVLTYSVPEYDLLDRDTYDYALK